jgi:xanthine dehydrogenase YagS FAD-binding subunit
LVALQAQLTIAGPAGNKTVKAENFFVGPGKSIDKENGLLPGEIVTGIQIPPLTGKAKSVYRKVRTRGSWDFAQASAAVVLLLENDVIQAARIVLGGVAPIPWRADSAEKAAAGKKLDAVTIASIADAAVTGANPLSGNGYKVEMVKGAVVEALSSLI